MGKSGCRKSWAAAWEGDGDVWGFGVPQWGRGPREHQGTPQPSDPASTLCFSIPPTYRKQEIISEAPALAAAR